MINKTDWPKPRESSALHRKALLDYVSRLSVCVESYKNGEIDADTALKTCRKILSEIDDPEFPFFAVRNFRGLFSFILYQLPNCRTRQPI
jgi:hypothetical protein